jgi:hypothetical protein
MSDTVIVHTAFRQHPIFPYLERAFENVRLNANIDPDLLFPTAFPSMAIILQKHPTSRKMARELVRRFEVVQSKFKNAFAIVYGQASDTDGLWTVLQTETPCGTLRMIRHPNSIMSELFAIINTCFTEMRDKERMKLQTSYFDQQKEDMTSSSMARHIAYDTLHELQIPEYECELIMECLPTLYHVVCVNEETLRESLPIHPDSIRSLRALFPAEKNA